MGIESEVVVFFFGCLFLSEEGIFVVVLIFFKFGKLLFCGIFLINFGIFFFWFCKICFFWGFLFLVLENGNFNCFCGNIGKVIIK